MNLGSVPTVPVGDTNLSSTTNPGGTPGSQAWTRDGRRFRLIKNSSAGAISPGRLVQGPAPNNGHLVLTPTADVPVGARTIRVTAGSGAGTNAPANTYAGGLLVVTTGGGLGISYGIKSHEAIVATAQFTVVLQSDDVVLVALVAATDRVSLIANPFVETVIATGTATAAGAVGLAVGTGLPPGAWGYVQVEGLAIGVADGAVAIGQAVSPSITTAGLLTINATTLPIIGSAVQAAAVGGATFAVSLNLP